MVTNDLSLAIKDLYRVFRRYKARQFIEVLDCCYGADERRSVQETLLAKPLARMTVAHFGNYLYDAMQHIGDIQDFKHFLPRLLELLPTDHGALDLEPQVFLAKLVDAKWRDWPKEEEKALETYLHALWQSVLLEFDDYSAIDEYLTGIMRAVQDLRPYLDHWLQDETLSSVRHLARFVYHVYEKITRDEPLNIYWQDHSEAQTQVENWLRHPKIEKNLEQAFFQNADEDFAEELSNAVEIARMLKRR